MLLTRPEQTGVMISETNPAKTIALLHHFSVKIHQQKLPGRFECQFSSSWWFQLPISKICPSLWIISPNRDEHKKYLKPQPRQIFKAPLTNPITSQDRFFLEQPWRHRPRNGRRPAVAQPNPYVQNAARTWKNWDVQNQKEPQKAPHSSLVGSFHKFFARFLFYPAKPWGNGCNFSKMLMSNRQFCSKFPKQRPR